MERHKLGLYSDGLANMLEICELMKNAGEPTADPVSYEQLGEDLNGVPIEVGFGHTELSWRVMPQSDYDFLLEWQGDVPGTEVYARTQQRSGASGIDFGNYSAIAGRPTFGSREGLTVYDVRLPLTVMVLIP